MNARAVLLLLASASLVAGLGSAGAKGRTDFAATALNVLPPGQSGTLDFPRTATDQLALYDRLTPRFGAVTAADLRASFKSARFGPDGRAVRTVRPRSGLRIVRDRWNVPHVYGTTRSDVAFGAGWATAEDRGILMNLLRGPGRIAALDVPGLDAFSLATSARTFVPSARTEAFLAAQIQLLRRQGAEGRRIVADVDAYVAGINAYNRRMGYQITPWTRNDVVAVATMIGAVFGAGGGDEARAAAFLDGLQRRLGADAGWGAFNDLRALDDPDSPVSLPGRFGSAAPVRNGAGNVVLDHGSIQAPGAAPAPRLRMSNALLVGRARSQTGRPLFVAGPQTGHNYPQILMELDLHGGGFDVRGAAFPGISMYVLIGRGKDYAWSATSANLDITDEYVETLCGDDEHYLYRGECRAMETFEAGTLLGAAGAPDRAIAFRQTVHGPVTGYATVGGERVAISSRRSTRGRELLTARFFADLSTNKVASAQQFLRAANRVEMTFNWLYADDRDIAQFSSGRLPVRAPGVDPGLPTRGTGSHEWRGFAPFAAHARAVNPSSGAILNWNNRPARGVAAADDAWSWGSVQRVDLLRREVAKRRKHSLVSLVAAMNKAATQDLRAVEVWPTIRRVLEPCAPDTLPCRLAALVDDWAAAGASRLDRDLDGAVDHPGAAIMDAAWPRLADAVLGPVLGPQLAELAALEGRDNRPSNGNAYGSGWYGTVKKDLRALLGDPVQRPFSRRYCGGGDLVACRASLHAALDAAAAQLALAQGTEPGAWRADANAERTRFGFLPASMRFANRPTFQQVMSFDGHRPRR